MAALGTPKAPFLTDRCGEGPVLAANHLVRCCLGHRTHDDLVQVDVMGKPDGVRHHLCHVLSRQWFVHALVHRICGFLVPAEPVNGEFIGADHSGGHLDDADIVLGFFQSQGTGQCVLAELGRVVAGAALLRCVPSGGGQV